ncbi:MAG: SURF1 family protein [Novosphingobium sp.]|uniref:SURF1 family protein n=1 Tax=Novosphingobium sp. TaxID=1874826 RepID=UPI003018D533
MKRIPIVPTLIVLIAVGVMIRLGFWQLERLSEKEAMLARYEAAQVSGSEVRWPESSAATERALYHRSRLDCRAARVPTTVSGRNAKGEAGLAHVATCADVEGGERQVVLGWSRDPASRPWTGGMVTGWIAPGPRLVADPPVGGLEANARPDPRDIPNNHLAYAVQWFLFAGVALVIYALALRKRMREG